uniref:Uncharacterized protein n=1 Tax=Mycobacterium kansasii TaxID=1768 RepID=A0A653EWH9_MYCKA|nr:hypothetical protein BIN_B_02855 [Mycobacterium kansasii]
MDPGPPYDPCSGAPPEAMGEIASRLDPAAAPDQHQNGGQQAHRSHEADDDRYRNRRSDRGKDRQFAEDHHDECDRHGRRRCRDYFADRHQCSLDSQVRSQALPHIVVISADQKDGIIRSGTDHYRAHENDRLRLHVQADCCQRGQRALGGPHRDTDGGQRHQHGDHVSVDDQQDDEHADRGADFDQMRIFLTDGGEVGHGDQTAGIIGGQCRTGDGLANDLPGFVVPRGGGWVLRVGLEHHRHVPGFVVLAGQDVVQAGRANEVLHRQVCLVQPVDQRVVGL